MINYHEFKAYEYEMPQCEDFGFKWEDIPKIEEAEKKYNSLSGFTPSEQLSRMKKDFEQKKPPRIIVRYIEYIAAYLLAIALCLWVSSFGMANIWGELWKSIVFPVIITAIILKCPIIKLKYPLGYIIVGPLMFFLSIFLDSYEYKLEKKHIDLKKEIDALQQKEECEYLEPIRQQYQYWYNKVPNFKKYKKAVDYHIKCNDKKHYEYWDRLQGGNGNAFEVACAEFLRDKGFFAKVSRIGADGGVDITAKRNNKTYACQCKAHKNKVSSGDIQKLIGVLMSDSYDEGYFFSLNGFSENAKEAARKSPKKIHCLSKQELIK